MSAEHSKRACSEATSTLRARLAQAGDDDNAAVVEWLSSYETGTDICFHPTPADLTATVRLSFLKDVIRAFCVELSRSHPDESLIDINWTRGLRLSCQNAAGLCGSRIFSRFRGRRHLFRLSDRTE